MRTYMTGTAEGAARVAVLARSAAPAAVVVAGLRKSYGAVQAVRGVSFTVRHGEIFALLGPNGAGKTTTLEIMEGFRTADAGRVEVLGYDPGDRASGRALREQIGLVLRVDWKSLGVLAAWGAAGALVAIRRFRWDPRPE